MKKHLRVLEEVGLVTTEKVGRTRQCTLGPSRLEDVQAWMDSYRALVEDRFDRLEQLLERTRGERHESAGHREQGDPEQALGA